MLEAVEREAFKASVWAVRKPTGQALDHDVAGVLKP